MAFTAQDVKALREKTGVGMMECKKALVESDGDMDKAIEYLRGFHQELKELDSLIAEQGNTPELLEKVHEKYTALWLFQLSFKVDSLPRVIGGLLCYPDSDE